MENRRPPRFNSSGRKPYFDQSRGTPYRQGPASGDGRNRPTGRGPVRSGDGRRDATDRTGGPRRSDGNRFGQGRPGDGRGRDGRSSDGRSRSSAPGKHDRFEPEIKITSDAQITDGKHRGKSLANSVSPHAAPTTRKIRETAFKIISRRVKAARVLDLGAGAGTMGIEAISRGAMLATFIERSARMCTFLRRNLVELGVKDGHGEVFEEEILPFLKKASRRKRSWDIVYFDLPDADECAAILEYLGRGGTLETGGLLLMAHSCAAAYPESFSKLKRRRTIAQGDTTLSIYERI